MFFAQEKSQWNVFNRTENKRYKIVIDNVTPSLQEIVVVSLQFHYFTTHRLDKDYLYPIFFNINESVSFKFHLRWNSFYIRVRRISLKIWNNISIVKIRN